MKFAIDHNFKTNLYVGLFCIYVVFVLCPSSVYYPSSMGLDASWRIGLNLANKENLNFGNDILFTYGPLGFLSTRNIMSLSEKWLIILSDIFIIAFLLYIYIYIFFSFCKTHIQKIIFLVCISQYANNGFVYFYDSSFTLLFIYSFFIFLYLKSPKIWYLFVSLFICVILFFIKLNIGFVYQLVFLVFISYLVLTKKLSYKYFSLIIGFYVVLLLAFSLLLNVDLIKFTLNGFQIIGGYSEAMCYELKYFLYVFFVLISIVVISLMYIVITKVIKKQWNSDLLILYCISFLSIGIAYKNGFVRVDGGHTLEFFNLFPPFLLLVFLFDSSLLHIKFSKKIFLLNICIGIVGIQLSLCNLRSPGLWPAIFTSKIEGEYQYIKKNFFAEDETFRRSDILKKVLVKEFLIAFSYKKTYGIRSFFSQLTQKDIIIDSSGSTIPQRIIKEISTKSVDILPWEISLAYFNSLKYNPRPVFQSYQAYSGFLDSINAVKYLSTTAPDYLLFKLASIDERPAMWDETKTKLAILRGYEIKDYFNLSNSENYLLYKKKDTVQEIIQTPVSVVSGSFGEYFKIPDSKYLILMKSDIEYSITGRFMSLIYHPPIINATFLLKNGDSIQYRIIRNIINAGVIANKNVISNSDFIDLNKMGVNVAEVSAIKMVTQSSSCFKNNFKIEFSELKLH